MFIVDVKRATDVGSLWTSFQTSAALGGRLGLHKMSRELRERKKSEKFWPPPGPPSPAPPPAWTRLVGPAGLAGLAGLAGPGCGPLNHQPEQKTIDFVVEDSVIVIQFVVMGFEKSRTSFC